MPGIDSRRTLLAVDVGLRMGFALFDDAGRLLRYGSRHLGSRSRLRALAARMLREDPRPARLLLEGGGPLSDDWAREAARLSISVKRVSAETWRGGLLLPRHQRSAHAAKANAVRLARDVIRRIGPGRPHGILRHDTAEAVLLGLWGLQQTGSGATPALSKR